MSSTTFMNAPTERDTIGAAVLGVPFDAATHPTRVGARLGPKAIRDQSSLIMPFDPATGLNLVEDTLLVDRGDVAVVPGDPGRSFPPATAAVADIIDRGAVPIVLGGDGLVTLPTLRALADHHDGLAVVHLDAHTDAYPGPGFSTAHTFTRAVEEGLIDSARSFHIGVRGTTLSPRAWSHAAELGFTVISTDEWLARGNEDVMAEVRSVIGAGPAHLSFDMDVFDPSVAPGVCTPAWGGLTAGQGLEAIDRLRGLRFVGFDNQTVSPPHDVAGMTALLAGTVVARFLRLLAE